MEVDGTPYKYLAYLNFIEMWWAAKNLNVTLGMLSLFNACYKTYGSDTFHGLKSESRIPEREILIKVLISMLMNVKNEIKIQFIVQR